MPTISIFNALVSKQSLENSVEHDDCDEKTVVKRVEESVEKIKIKIIEVLVF